jgi:hypothetical protein
MVGVQAVHNCLASHSFFTGNTKKDSRTKSGTVNNEKPAGLSVFRMTNVAGAFHFFAKYVIPPGTKAVARHKLSIDPQHRNTAMMHFENLEAGASRAGDQQAARLQECAYTVDMNFDRQKESSLTPTQKQARQSLDTVMEFFGGSTLSGIASNPHATPAELQEQQKFFTHIDQVISRIPRNTTVDAARFDAYLGRDNAALARAAGLNSISRYSNDHVVLNFNAAETYNSPDGSLIRDRRLEFDYSNRNGTTELANIQGLRASSGVTVNVDDVKLTHLPGGNTRLQAEGSWGFFHGSKTLVFGPNGETIP